MTWQDSCWMGEFRIPVQTSLVCAIFKSGDLIDKGGRATYAQMTLNPTTNTNYPGAYAGWGILRNPLLAKIYGIPDFCDSLNKIDNETMFFWIRQELRFHPNERGNMLKYAMPLLKALGQEKTMIEQTLCTEIDFLFKDSTCTEQPLLDAMHFAKTELLNDSLVRTLEQRIIQKFPQGLLARDLAARKISGNLKMEQDERIRAITSLFEKFPPELYLHRKSSQDKIYYDLLRGFIYLPVVQSHDYSILYKYLKSSPSWLLSTYFWHLVQLPHRNKEVSGEKIEPLATHLIQEILTRPREGNDRLIPPSEYNNNMFNKNANAFFSYAQILADCNRFEEALEWGEKLKPIFRYKDASFNEFYVNLLIKKNKAQEAIAFIKKSIYENTTTQPMLDVLLKDYKNHHKSDKGFETYIEKLKSPELLQALQEKVKQSMIKEKIADFSWQDLKGKTTHSQKLKGKILILDFWATWCAPCKAALPAMKMAVNKFHKDKDVAFYFVTTQEKNDGLKEKVKKFITDKGYTQMNFVFDLPGEGKTNDRFYAALAHQFHCSGIPLKVIIDSEGYLRWCSIGYMGSPTELVDEISFVIEEIKKESR